ncbi:THAP domain-containing protein 1-like [Haliotis rubra]|uniref:THAP domain-containing protein 1-like n=1 Tax=Haliotis rubra TaxID=36100 RepID=UPI001EE53500|nr:THAP domain-containing protein 1-like [Haliotis rubra]
MAADHCSLPQCTSDARYNNSLSFHTFLKAEDVRRRWIIAIRRDEGPFFTITRKSVVCSKHFRPEDYKYTPVRRTLKQGFVPSIFPWNLENMKSRKAPAIRHPLMPKQVISWESPENADSMSYCDPHAEGEHQLSAQTQTDISLFDSQVLLKRIQKLEEENDLLKQQLS